MRRWLLWSVASVVLVLVGLLSAVVVTESGARFVWDQVRAQVPDLLPGTQVDGEISGRLIGPLVIERLSYATMNERVEVARVAFDWHPGAIFDGVVDVRELNVAGVRVALGLAPADDSVVETSAPSQLYPELPINLNLQSITVSDVVLITAPEAAPITVEQVALQAQFDEERFELAELSVRTEGVVGRLQAGVQNEAALPFQLSGSYSVALADRPTVEGSFEGAGDLKRAQLNAAAKAPYNIDVDVALDDLLGALRAQVIARAEATPIDGVHAAVDGQLMYANLVLDYAPGNLLVEELSIALGDANLQLTGGYDLASDNMDITGQWRHLAWPLRSAGDVNTDADAGADVDSFASERGEFTLAGTLQDYQLTLEADAQVPGGGRGTLQVDAVGTDEQLTLRRFDLDPLGLELSGNGRVDWAQGLSAQLNLSGNNLDPAVFEPSLSGGLDLDVDLTLASDEQGVRGNISQLRLTGALNKHPVNVDLVGDFDSASFHATTVLVQVGESALSGQGGLGRAGAGTFTWDLRVDKLADLSAELQGVLFAQGKITGTFDAPSIAMTFTANELEYASLPAERFSFTGELAGRLDEHRLNVGGNSSWGAGELEIVGHWADENYALELLQLVVPLPNEDRLSLTEPVQGQFSTKQQMLPSGTQSMLCLSGTVTELCAGFEVSEKNQEARFKLDNTSLELLAPLVPPALAIAGVISGEGTLTGWQNPKTQQGLAALDIAGLIVRTRATGEDEPLEVLAFQPAKVEFELTGEHTRLYADLPLAHEKGGVERISENGGVRVTATLLSDNSEIAERALAAEVTLALPSIGMFDEFSADVSELRGGLSSDLVIGGKLAAPEISGSAALTDAHLTVPELGIAVDDMNVQLEMPKVGELEVEGSLRSGVGELSIDGQLVDVLQAPSGVLTLKGDRFEVANNGTAQVQISPQLDIELRDNQVYVEGDVHVPVARIELEEVPASAVQVSDDQILIDALANEEGADPIAVHARINLSLGEAVSFEGLGLTAEFAGGINIVQEPQEVTTANGEIVIKQGLYQAYGQDLDVQDGKLIWVGGALTNPGIDIVAMRQPKPDIKVGVRARGTLSQPKLQLTSTPSLTESDQLSYLILGRPMEGSSQAEGSYLNKAALALGIKGGNYLTERYGDKLGVDQIGIETAPGEDAEQAALVVGKYLSPRLYVSYGLGLLDSISTLRLEYSLNRFWSLETESSAEQSGGDIRYTIEVD